MSSVYRKTSDDANRVRDAFEFREKQLKENNEKSKRDIQLKHGAEIESITNQSREIIQEIREQSRQKLNEQEQRHVKEIDAIKSMYQKKLAEKATGD